MGGREKRTVPWHLFTLATVTFYSQHWASHTLSSASLLRGLQPGITPFRYYILPTALHLHLSVSEDIYAL